MRKTMLLTSLLLVLATAGASTAAADDRVEQRCTIETYNEEVCHPWVNPPETCLEQGATECIPDLGGGGDPPSPSPCGDRPCSIPVPA